MKLIQNPMILLKDKIDKSDFDAIDKLRLICTDTDRTALKLELDYKLNSALTDETCGPAEKISEFMYYDGKELIGYIGICDFGGEALEVNGMVHPEYRRKGVFKKLFSIVQDEWYKRDAPKMLLLSDRKSAAGQAFIKRTHADFEHAEHEMYLRGSEAARNIPGRVSLRIATNEDSREIGMQNAAYFGTEYSEEHVIKPEDEARRGLMIYLAEAENAVVGKIHLEQISRTAGIYGFGVKPEYRRKGYGREILSLAVEKLKEGDPEQIILQVEVMNDNALNLYKSCGFEVTSTMDYYELSK